MIQLLLAPLAW